jgi:hypothetical protein
MKVKISRSSIFSRKLTYLMFMSPLIKKIYASDGEYPNIRFHNNLKRIEVVKDFDQQKIVIKKR